MPQTLKRLAGAATSAALIAGSIAAPATADPPSSQDTYSALVGVTGLEGKHVHAPFADLAMYSHKSPSVPAANNIFVTLPETADSPITIEDRSNGEQISMSLDPTVDDAGIEVLPNGHVSYMSENSYSTTPLVKTDGSVQVTTVIEDETAPAEYRYTLDLPAGSTLKETPSGGYMIVDSNGDYDGGIAPPWAVDSEGNEVDTSFHIEDGDTLVQTVRHDKNTAYPVVADPMWGKDLISSVKWISRNGVVSMSVTPTGWNRFNVGFEPAITAGWEEAKNKTPRTIISGKTYSRSTAATTQMFWQYRCHQVGAFAKGDWNLEPHRYRNTYQDYVFNLCN